MFANKLKKGDTIGVVCPSDKINDEDIPEIKEAERLLKERGYNVVFGKNVYKNTTGYGATAKEKAEDINEMYANKNINAIISLKGGFNSNSVYEYLDIDTIKSNNKIICGYSDSTSYINYIHEKTGNIGFIGPNFKSLNAPDTNYYLLDEMLKRFEGNYYNLATDDSEFRIIKDKSATIRDKCLNTKNKDMETEKVITNREKNNGAIGKLVGGNLSLITELIDEIDFTNKILFLEEFSFESPSAMVSNYLYRLRQKGVFNKLSGIWLGNYDGDVAIEKILMDTINDMNVNIPIIKSDNFGHIERKITIPLGVKAEIKDGKIKLIEDYLK